MRGCSDVALVDCSTKAHDFPTERVQTKSDDLIEKQSYGLGTMVFRA